MPIEERTLYRSENGDCWSLAHDPEAGALFVRHQANLPSGGHVSDVALGEFLTQGSHGPETQELRRLIAGLVGEQQETGSTGQTTNGQTPGGGAGLVASYDNDLARDMCAALREVEMLFGSLARQLGSAGFEHAPDDLKRASREMANVQERITSRLRGA